MPLKLTTFYFFLLSTLFFCACSSTRDMQVLVTRPALFEMPDGVQKILLVNRSKGNAKTIIEGILTGELPERDKNLSEQCMSGLLQTLTLNKKLVITRHNENLNSERGSSTGFGTVLQWGKVDELAKQYNADAILMLEFFDTDFSVRDVIGNNSSLNIFIRATAQADAGFRLYYPKNKSILYEKSFRSSGFYTENAVSRSQAMSKLIAGTDALSQVSYRTGQNFARRITAYTIWEDRLMYKGRKNEEMTRGERLVVANNWQQGVDAWLKAYNNTNNASQKGEIAYNLALGYEVLDNLEEAKKWITTSYVDSGNKKALEYSQIINKRIENEGISNK